MTALFGRQLQFTRDGRTLVVAEPCAITLVDVAGHGRRRIEIAEVQAIAAFADQVWVATSAGVLHRLGVDGEVLDAHAISVDPEATLCAAQVGGPAALWTGHAPAMLVDDLGRLVSVPVEVDATHAIPIAGRRLAHHAGPRLTLPAGTAVTLASGAQIAGGCVIFDGSSLALVADHPHGRGIVVLALASGRTMQHVAAPRGEVRLATRRGLAVVQHGARQLALIDLKFGRALGTVVAEGDVHDLAIDPDGTTLVLRLSNGELEIAHLDERRGVGTRRLALAQQPEVAEAAQTEAGERITERAPPGGSELAKIAQTEPTAPPSEVETLEARSLSVERAPAGADKSVAEAQIKGWSPNDPMSPKRTVNNSTSVIAT